LFSAASLALLAGTCLAQPSFHGLGDLPGGNTLSEGWAVSGDGRVVVGASITGGSGFSQQYSPFRWTQDGGLEALVINFGSTKAFAVSRDGSVITGVADFGFFSDLGTQSFRWTSGGGLQLIGDLDGGALSSFGRGISSDGQFIAGIGSSASGTEAFRYDSTTGERFGLGSLEPTPFGSYGYAMSGDGNVIVGLSVTAASPQVAYIWTAGEGMQAIGVLPTPNGVVATSSAEAISRDGQVVVGQARSMASGQAGEAFRWTRAGGFEVLGDFPGGAFQSWAYATNADGSVVVGRASVAGSCGPFGCGSAPRAFIWTPERGLEDLAALLVSRGVNLDGWRLDEARGISDDGSVIVGTGLNPQGLIEGWVANLGSQGCPADFNGDTQVDFFDYLDFAAAFDVEDMSADFNGDNQVDFFDYLDFAAEFDNGCD
jgi:uncharacterized membrane protein